MPGAQLDIERIIREVMRRLQDNGSAGGGAGTETKASPKPKTDKNKLRVGERVVTLASLDGRLRGVKEVIVPNGAVVTPAVRDELRKKKVRLTFAEKAHAANASTDGMLVGMAAGSYDAAAVFRAVSVETRDVDRLDGDCWIELVRQLSQAIAAKGRFGMLITSRAAAAACLANREKAVRAVLGVSVTSVKDAMQTVGANLLIVDPASLGLHEIRGMVREFARGSHECPDALKAVLEK
jgi:hypothetical protein